METTMRVITWNVHQFRTATSWPNALEVMHELKELDSDIVLLQECAPILEYLDKDTNMIVKITKPVETLAMSTGYPFWIRSGECAILSKHKILRWDSIPISQGFCIQAIIDSPHAPINFVSVYLNYKDEETRISQIRIILESLYKDKIPVVLGGDFNSLTEDDYLKSDFEKIKEVRKKNDWEEPKYEVTNMIKDKGYIDVWKQPGTDISKYDRNAPGTCRFDTRIDYFYMNKTKLFKRVHRCEILKTNISDHDILVLDFL